MTKAAVRMDADTAIFFSRQLEYIMPKVYEFEYPELMAFRVLPINTNFSPGAEFITATGYQSVGRARLINSYADDLPEAGLLGMQLTNPVVGIGTSYRYSYQEIRAARLANLNLPMRLAEAARRANDQMVNDLALLGSPATGLYGLVNNPNINATPVPNDGTGASTLWTTKTGDQIIRDMNLIVNTIVAQSNNVERPNTLLLPQAQYSLIASTPRSQFSDTTILQYFLLNNPYIREVIPVPQLAGAGEGDVDIMIAYDRNPDKIFMAMPLMFVQHPPQERNLEFVIPCESRFGGTVVYYPLSVLIGEGI